MYTLAGLMMSLTITALLVNARHEQTVREHQQFNEAIEQNENHWTALINRYAVFDTLKAESTPQAIGYDLQGHWQREGGSSELLQIEADGQQTEFRHQRRADCYKAHKSVELVYYGDVNMLVNDRSGESRFHYRLGPDHTLTTERLYTNGALGSERYTKIDPREALDISFCDDVT